jgi:RNA polymerase sigma factor (sigma-70 family)
MSINLEVFFRDPTGDGRVDGHPDGSNQLSRNGLEAWHRAAILVTNDHHLAEDAVQHAFLKLLKLPGDVLARIPADRRQAYLVVAVRNEARRLTTPYRQEIALDEKHARSLPCAAPPPDAKYARSRLQHLVRAMIGRLPERCRQVMSLYLYEQMTRREVAKHLGMTPGAVEKQITRGYRLLGRMPEAQHLPEWHDGGG